MQSNYGTPSRPSLIKWQCWISLLQSLASIVAIVFWVLFAVVPKLSKTLSIAWWVAGLVLWILVFLNDIFILTMDLKRTSTYLGCIAFQATLNFMFSALSIYFTVHRSIQDPLLLVFYGFPGLFVGIYSLCLLIITLWPIAMIHVSVPGKQLWTANAKDALRGVVPLPSFSDLGVLGRPRGTAIPNSVLNPFPSIARVIKRFLVVLFFRRVRNVETRAYAFARNSFAVVAMGVLIFRTATALQQAQNEIGTRTVSDNCFFSARTHRLSILSDRLIYDNRWNTSLPPDVNITISVVWSNPSRGYETYNTTDCSFVWSKMFQSELDYRFYQNRTLELFDCSMDPDPTFDYSDIYYTLGEFSDSYVYRVEARPAAGTSGQTLFDSQMPRIWLVNRNHLNSTDLDQSNVGEVRTYLPPFKLLRGSHIATEANLVTRRLIESSIVRDIIFQSKPNHRILSLYPIVESSVAMLNSSDANVATATIRPILNPGLMYHRSQANVEYPDDPLRNVCDFVDDYRTGTILDVIGSVGGLFALLQAAHLLLFGRPLFWGLTGAKTITPFGLLGGCSSGGFKRRLREEYHSKSDEDDTDTIRIVKFLQDFVIDFGPADLDLEGLPAKEKTQSSPTLVANEDSVGSRIPLVQMNSDTNDTTQKNNDAEEEENHTKHRDSTHNDV